MAVVDAVRAATARTWLTDDVSQPTVVRLPPLDSKPRGAQGRLDCIGGCLDAVFLVSEQVNVPRGPAGDPARE